MEIKGLYKSLENKEVLEEIIIILLASIFLGFVLALEVTWPKIIINEFIFLEGAGIAFVMLSVFVISQKITAYYLDCKTKIKLISFRKYWFQSFDEKKAELPFEFPAWLFLPLIFSLATNGLIKWLAILNFDIEPKATRMRKRWQELTEADVGKIAIAGPISVLLLGFIFRLVGLNEYALLCSWLAFLSLVPIGLGFKILNTARIAWVFSFVFTLFILLLMNVTTSFAGIVIALLIAAIITITYYSLYEK
ncbi:MAG: hypothetical protein N3G19_03135 [Candidatus Pacearchaeota archaeon]|nr:hypothetical protein [Candidatus Pacearchaeota archaeon]